MTSIVALILPYILLYKYFAIFIITLFAALAFPIPPGTLLMASSAFAAQGYFSFWLIIFAGSLGNIIGDNIGYWLARKYGREILIKIGLKKVLNSEKYKIIEDKLKMRPGFLIFATRFDVFANLAVNVMCGLGRVPYKKYLIYEITGELAQVILYCSIGYFVGDNWKIISPVVNKSLLIILAIIILFMIIFWKKIWKNK